tara:strand:- start:284 stop:727 length:444 start_codon:yes stop_codon:yes gene_type:complete
MTKPFKMKGSPMQRNFGIGNKKSPESTSPYNKLTKEQGLDMLSAGMATLPGGFDSRGKKGVEYERDKDGKLILGQDGKPIVVQSSSSATEVSNPAEDLGDGEDFSEPLTMKGSPAKHSIPDHHLAKNQHDATTYKGGSDKGRFKKKK